jgi:hypothetical protein
LALLALTGCNGYHKHTLPPVHTNHTKYPRNLRTKRKEEVMRTGASAWRDNGVVNAVIRRKVVYYRVKETTRQVKTTRNKKLKTFLRC